MHLSVDSTKPVADLRGDLRRACIAHGLVVATVSDATAPGRASFVLEIADPLPELHPAARPERADGSTYKIAGFDRPGGGTRLSTMRPTHLVDLLGHPELDAPARRLERVLEAVLREAAGG
jgi:hypothetical protein